MANILNLIKNTPHILRAKTKGARLRMSLLALGPIYVKFGQMLSTRRDLLSEDMADELAKLQDQVPPFSSTIARKIIKDNLNEEVDSLFSEFEDIPLGSASIAQVHGARLKTGEEVVIKILRPGIEQSVARDIRFLSFIATLLGFFSRTFKQLDLKNVVQEFRQITTRELDLNEEVANASQLKRNMQSLPWVIIPTVYWSYTRKNIAVFSRIHATRISHKELLLQEGIDLTLLAQRTIELFFTAVFEHNFFHADMHAGNIFVKKAGDDLQYILVDFGIMGTLPASDQRYLAENLAAFFHQDYQRVAQLHIASGWVPAQTRQDAFANAIRTVCEPIFSRPAHEISFAELFMALLDTARKFDMVILPQMILLQKTLMNVEGLARFLDPQIDIWDTAKPCLDRWFKQRSSFKVIRQQLRDAPLWITQVLQLPGLATSTLENLKTYQNNIPKIKSARYKSFASGFVCAAFLSSILIILGI